MDLKDLDNFDFNLLDVIKDWFEDVFFYEYVGIMMFDCNLDNIFVEIELVGFNFGVFVCGMFFFEDCLL